MPDEAPVMTATGVDLFVPLTPYAAYPRENAAGAPGRVHRRPPCPGRRRSDDGSQPHELDPPAPEVATPRQGAFRFPDTPARLSTWLRAHGNEELSRELRGAAARLNSNEPAGLYALQTSLRKVRALSVDEGSQQRLKALSTELRNAVQDRFEQLELLPFKRS
jgi:hypothetical protein